MKTDLSEYERIAKAATADEWHIVEYGDGDSLVIHSDDDHNRVCFMATPGESPGAMARIEANALHIATFNPIVVLELLAEVGRLREGLEKIANGAEYAHCIARDKTDAHNFKVLADVSRQALSPTGSGGGGEQDDGAALVSDAPSRAVAPRVTTSEGP